MQVMTGNNWFIPRGKMASCPTLICLFACHVGRWGTISWSHPFGARGLLWDRVPWLQLNRGNMHFPHIAVALSCTQWIEVPGVNHLSFGVSDALEMLLFLVFLMFCFFWFITFLGIVTTCHNCSHWCLAPAQALLDNSTRIHGKLHPMIAVTWFRKECRRILRGLYDTWYYLRHL